MSEKKLYLVETTCEDFKECDFYGVITPLTEITPQFEDEMKLSLKRKASGKKLTQEQKARIYCVKHGHANYITMFWGEVYCGRCQEKIGDRLMSFFDLKGCLVIGHRKNCKECKKAKITAKFDWIIIERLRENYKKKKFNDYEKVLEGVKFD